jgi:hypothetical protein
MRGRLRQRLCGWGVLGMQRRDDNDRLRRLERIGTDAGCRFWPRFHATDLRPGSRPLAADDAER